MRKNHILILFYSVITAVSVLSCTKDVGKLPESTGIDCNKITYAKDIKPLIDNYCVGCHSSNFASGDLVTHSDVKLKVDNGTLMKVVVIDKTMPEASSLTKEEIQKFKCWIESGALNN